MTIEADHERARFDPRFGPAVEMIGRTGATNFQLRYSDDESPVVWMAVATYGDRFECAAAPAPLVAIFRLCDQLIDGVKCTHCGRIAAFFEELVPRDTPVDAVADAMFCAYRFDPELATFRRDCEGDTP